MDKKVLIFSAPSGSGKSTIVQHLLEIIPNLEFSISATSRAVRGDECDSVDYYFLSDEEFERKVKNGEFIEWEEVYAGTRYGTLRSEINRIWSKKHIVIFDIDVVGGVNLKDLFKDNALSIFIQPPSIEELRNRLEGRGTDSAEAIEKRLIKATQELEYKDKYDIIVVNDNLQQALLEAEAVVRKFINE